MTILGVEKIISGGQTGADRAALDFAIAHSIAHGGACPKGRFAEDGRLAKKYQMTEVGMDEKSVSHNYALRTLENIKNANGTLIIVPVYPIPEGLSDGTRLTIEKAQRLGAHNLVYQLSDAKAEEVKAWLHKHKIRILNVAGPRESNFPGMYQATYALLERVFRP